MKIETIVTLGLPNPCHRRDPRLLLWRAWHRLTGVRRGCSCSRCFHHPKSPHAPAIAARVRCARDSDWCDGFMCADIGNPGCPNSDIAAVGRERGCIGPYPCGVGAGGNGGDLPCDCESIARERP